MHTTYKKITPYIPKFFKDYVKTTTQAVQKYAKSSSLLNTIVHKIWPQGYILAYHRVANLENDVHQLCVTIEHFEEHLLVINKKLTPVSLDEMVTRIQQRKSIDKLICITFDDGYADNLHNAYPLLKKHNIPATVYVTAGLVSQQYMPWVDQLAFIFCYGAALPNHLNITIAGTLINTSMNTTIDYNEVHWHIHNILWHCTEIERVDALLKLHEWAKLPQKLYDTHKILSTLECQELIKDSLVTIGAHTMTHCSLPSENHATQLKQLIDSKLILENITGKEVSHFAYPYSDFNIDTPHLVKEAGYISATTVQELPLCTGCNPYLLPRRLVLDMNGDDFERLLRPIL